MELSSIAQQLLQQSRQAQANSLAKLVEVGAIKPDTLLTALVGKVTTISPEQKQTLVNQWLRQGNSAQDTQQKLQTLLQKPQLLAAEIKLFQAQQWVITDQPLITGQKIPVMLTRDLHLQLLKNPAPQLQSAENRGQEAKSPQLLTGEAKLTPSTQTGQHSKLPSLTEAIRAEMRATLPFEKSVASVIQNLNAFNLSATQLPITTKQSLFEPSTWKLLSQIANLAKPPHQLAQPPVLKQTFLHSGLLAEARATKPIATQTTTPSNAQNQIPTNTLTQVPKIQIMPATETISPSKQAAPPQDVDIKIALQALETLTHPPSATNPMRTFTNSSMQALFAALAQLQGHSARTTKGRELMTSIRTQINAQAQGALAKITSLQLQHLLQQSSDSSLSPNGGILEIPVRLGDNIVPLVIYLQEKWLIDPEQENKKQQKKNNRAKFKKRWQVFMEFDLEADGFLACEITATEDNLSTKIWADQPPLRERAKQKIDMLRQKLIDSGIEVSEITLAAGKAPKKQTGMDFSLVDITT